MNYRNMNIHDRINLKGTYETFLKIAVQRFRDSMDKKIYRTRQSVRKGKKQTRTRELYNSFKTTLSMGVVGNTSVRIDFLMYGRFVDMGVGRGMSLNYALVRKRFGAKRTGITRRPKRWYPKKKRHEELRLQEIMAQRYGVSMVTLVEQALEKTFTVNLT